MGNEITQLRSERRVSLQITRERDLPMLSWIGRYGIVSVEQVGRHWFASDDHSGGYRAAARRVRKLEQAGYLVRDRVMHNASTVLRLTHDGHRLVGLSLRPAELSPPLVEHHLAVVDLAEGLRAQHPDWQLLTEREYRVYRRVAIAAGLKKPRSGQARVPDCVFLLPKESEGTQQLWIAVELERTEKTPERVRQIIESYYRDPPKEVRWYVTRDAAQRYRQLIHKERADRFMTVEEWSAS